MNFKLLTALAVAMPFFAMSQNGISGRVVSTDGEPLAGAQIVVNNTVAVYYTNQNGAFKTGKFQEGPLMVEISYLGFTTLRDTLNYPTDQEKTYVLNPNPVLTEEVVVEATRFKQDAPATFKNIEKKEIQKLNLGQDLPILLNWTPSLVSTSDAGAGIGYTGIRIRGSDQTRINVTINGIPVNDSESQGVFWVNMPDLATSLSSIQIQRGLGSSTNGSGAFGASINMQTNNLNQEAGGLISNSLGSFNTRRHTVQFQTGLMDNNFAFEGRLSNIASDGYIDRASSDLSSYFLSGGYYGAKTVVKALAFGGKERTYQSWYGTPESRIDGDRDAMLRHAANNGLSESQTENLLNSGRTYNFYEYENEVDDYRQDHYQLHLIQELNDQLDLTVSGHYTIGRGFFEQFREDDSFANYGKPTPVIGDSILETTDLVRRRWLDNDFYGGTFTLNYNLGRDNFTLGGGGHFYRGDHFGEIVWAEHSSTIDHLERYYEGVGNKDDINVYGKWEGTRGDFSFMADLQLRAISYTALGTDNDLSTIDVKEDFLFFNPKVGVRYTIDPSTSVYAYLGRGSREPVRNDFIDAIEGQPPVYETLNNLELGYTYSQSNLLVNANAYLMYYENQLVLTGELNDVGASVRRNVDRSYRLGIELDATYTFSPKFAWNINTTLSRNKVLDFNEVIYDYSSDEVGIVNTLYSETDISFSPSIIGASRLIYAPIPSLEFNLISKYVGLQYLDNTQNEDRSIDPYFTNDLRIAYSVDDVIFKRVELSLLVNNILNAQYSSNGYTFSYIAGDLITENFFYPQAGTNFLLGLNLMF